MTLFTKGRAATVAGANRGGEIVGSMPALVSRFLMASPFAPDGESYHMSHHRMTDVLGRQARSFDSCAANIGCQLNRRYILE